MPKIEYETKTFRPETLKIIVAANDIIEEYEAQGYSLTLRQLYYQFVARGLIPNNTKSYDRLGDIISDARMAGYIDWESITDRTRYLLFNTNWESPMDLVGASADGYHVDFWEGQRFRPEVWIEKNALIDVIAGVCSELDVPHFACVGYTSQTEMWNAGQRLRGYLDDGYTPIVLHLGDHDPSGIDMTRDIKDRLRTFSRANIRVERLALNMSQIQQYGPPPNPAKPQDSRYADYVREYGTECWELDALEPQVIVDLVRTTLENMIDRAAWNKVQARWKEEQETLRNVAKYWEEVTHYVGLRGGS